MLSSESLTFNQNIKQKIWERLGGCPQIDHKRLKNKDIVKKGLKRLYIDYDNVYTVINWNSIHSSEIKQFKIAKLIWLEKYYDQ